MADLTSSSNLRLRVMADHASSGIWVIGSAPPPWRHGMIDHSALGLDKDLARRFTAWITRYEEEALEGKLDIEAFNRDGLELARRLKDALGRNVYVEYDPEWSADPRPHPIVIE